jgi:Rieske Fe-S protein
MNRREFIAKGCTACLTLTAMGALLSSCESTQYISGRISTNGITVPLDDFKIKQRGNTAYRSFIIVRNESLKYPICLYRLNNNQYSALWMRCTHQGTELQASGDTLQCPAHGSEFSNEGKVLNGPADTRLRTFPVTVSNDEIFIDLRKQIS